MTNFAGTFTASVDAVVSATSQLAESASRISQVDDTTIIESQRSIAQARRNLDAIAAKLAGETAARSTSEAGLTGLAQKEGFRTPEALVKHVTGSTGREAAGLVRVGVLLNDADDVGSSDSPREPASDRPWLASVAAEVAAGRLSVAAAEAIRSGLGVVDAGVTAESLAEAAQSLVAESAGLDADELYRRARAARDNLDELGIASRERARREQRSLRRWRKPDGMTRYTWELDPEGAALTEGPDLYPQLLRGLAAGLLDCLG